MNKVAIVYLAALGALVGCGGAGEGSGSGSTPAGYSSNPPGGQGLPGNPFSPGGSNGGGSNGGNGGNGGSGGGDCMTICNNINQCGFGDPVDCNQACANPPSAEVLACYAAAGCDLEKIGACDNGSGGTGGGGTGGSGTGGTSGADCNSTCAAKESQCSVTIDCSGFCASATSSDIMCLSGISCALIYTCGATVSGGGGTGGTSAGGCTVAPDCGGCVSGSCEECLCYYDSTTCAPLCG